MPPFFLTIQVKHPVIVSNRSNCFLPLLSCCFSRQWPNHSL